MALKALADRLARPRQRGSVAIEMALVLSTLVVLLTVPVFFARVFWYYSVAQKAAHDAARFLSTASQAELRTPGPNNTPSPVAAIARQIAETETAVLDSVMDPKFIDVQCNFGTCGAGVPATVRVFIQMRMRDDLFAPYTFAFYGQDGLLLTADVTMRYAGN